MTGDEQQNLPTTWKDALAGVAEGGLPQLIAGPAGKAISRLVGAAVEIPAAWLEQKAQTIRDETEARSKVMQVLSEKAAELGIQDERLLGRGLDNLLGRAFREQENREAVAVKVVEQLSEEPAQPGSEGPSDDWLNVFEQHAAKASSEELRETWARVLAGEIRKPNAFSLKTLQFLSVLDKETALAAEALLSRVVDINGALIGEVSGETFMMMQKAREAGLIGQLDIDTIVTVDVREDGLRIHAMGDVAIVARADPGSQYKFECTTISTTAMQVYPIVRPKPSEAAIELFIQELKGKPVIKTIERGRIVRDGNKVFASDLQRVWERTANDVPQQ
ncbi:DUF2806 domain-containing protein [Pararhizobium sp. LjRoot238]|uniref:DUF2806 domain-containing protein n=1 Tax=Pararhizobium sp. LjRoot238 TaxID=3342293 RepID=UPI003ECDBFB3